MSNRILSIAISLLGLLLYAVFYVGLLLHTSSQPSLLGKYSRSYTALLVFAAFVAIPLYRLLRFLSSESRVSLPSGRVYRFSSWKKVLLYALVVLVALAPVEVYLRLRSEVSERVLDQYHPYLQQQPVADNADLHVNAHRFRGEALIAPKPEGAFRIFFLGGSTVFCETDPFETTHPRLLERHLRERYPSRKIELYNAGYPWYTSEHSVINYLFKIKDFEPDLILVWHGINDLCRSFEQEDLTYGSYQPDYSHYLGPTARMAKHYARTRSRRKPLISVHSYAIAKLVDALRGVVYSDLKPPPPPVAADFPLSRFHSLDAFRRNMTTLVEQTQRDGVQIVLATQPTIYRLDLNEDERRQIVFPRMFCVEDGAYPDLASMVRAMSQYNEHVREVASHHGVPLVDLDRLIPKEGEYFFDDCHFTEAGNARVAQEMFEFLIEQKVIESLAIRTHTTY